MNRAVNLVGRSVALADDIPAIFDAPLAPHHKIVGKWVAGIAGLSSASTRQDARVLIQRSFDIAVRDILEPFELADLAVTVHVGDGDLPPAIAVTCTTVGQIDLGWIEADNVLSQTLFGPVAPLGWRAAAYRALCSALPAVLPILGYDELFEEIAAYHWDGEIDDESARRCQIEWQGADPDDFDEDMLPSTMNARRPDWMIAANAALRKDMPKHLRQALHRLDFASTAVRANGSTGSAWHIDTDLFHAYIPGFEDCSHLPPLTLVPFEHFARELDEIAHHGMETGFTATAGLCQLDRPDAFDTWLVSLQLGAELLHAAQDLLAIDPATLR